MSHPDICPVILYYEKSAISAGSPTPLKAPIFFPLDIT